MLHSVQCVHGGTRASQVFGPHMHLLIFLVSRLFATKQNGLFPSGLGVKGMGNLESRDEDDFLMPSEGKTLKDKMSGN